MIHLIKFKTLPTDSLNAVNNHKACNLFCMIHDFTINKPLDSKQKAIFDTGCFVTLNQFIQCLHKKRQSLWRSPSPTLF